MLQGKIAIVTGSTSGIGLGIANRLGDDHGVRVAYSPADMSKPADISGMVSLAVEQLGGVDILVNNAGIQHVAPVVDFSEERWDAVIAINLSAAFHATKAALPHMTAKGWGRIINIASAHGLVASGEKVAYVTAKHGLVGLTKVVAIETANHGVTCNAICPGWVLTPLVQKQIEARAAAQGIPYQQAHDDLLREKQPMLHYTTPEKIGGLAVFLCSEAASTMTGAALSIDGGWVAQ